MLRHRCTGTRGYALRGGRYIRYTSVPNHARYIRYRVAVTSVTSLTPMATPVASRSGHTPRECTDTRGSRQRWSSALDRHAARLQAPPRALRGAHPCARPHGRARLLPAASPWQRTSALPSQVRRLQKARAASWPRTAAARARVRPAIRLLLLRRRSSRRAAARSLRIPEGFTSSDRVADAAPSASASESDESTTFSLGTRARSCFGLGSARASCEDSTRVTRRSAAILSMVRTCVTACARASRLALATGRLVRAMARDEKRAREGTVRSAHAPSARFYPFWRPS